MKKIEILVVGKHPEIMKTILRLINNKPEFNATAAFSVTEVIDQANTITFNLVFLGAGLDENESNRVKAQFDVPVVQHYGGGSGLLYAEIYQALNIY